MLKTKRQSIFLRLTTDLELALKKREPQQPNDMTGIINIKRHLHFRF